MSNVDRAMVVLAVLGGTNSSIDGAKAIMGWIGAGGVVTGLCVMLVMVLVPFAYVVALQKYRRHGWRATR